MPLTEQEELELLELEEQEAQSQAKASPAPAPARGGFWDFPKTTLEEKQTTIEKDIPAFLQAAGGAAGAGAIAKIPGLAKSGLAALIGRVGAQGGLGAALDKENPIRGGLVGLGSGLAGEGIGAAMRKAGDVGMQMAMGRRKYTPGVGEILADEGLIGTERAVRGQVQRKLGERGAQLQEAAKAIPGRPIQAEKIGLEIAEEASKPMAVGRVAQPSQADAAKIKAVQEFAEDIVGRGAESGPEALARRIAAGGRAYRGKEDPLQSLIGQMSKAEQMKYSQALKDVSPEIASIDPKYAALKKAQAALEGEASLPKNLFGLLSTGFTSIPSSTLVGTGLGQGLVKGGQALPPAFQQIIPALQSQQKKK